MRANDKFLNRDSDFWAYSKLISEQLGYSKKDRVLSHERDKVLQKLLTLNVSITEEMLSEVLSYLDYRAAVLNTEIKDLFMTAEQARKIFNQLLENYHIKYNFTCPLPLNKQKGEKRDYAYFTGIINILTEIELRKYAKKSDKVYGTDIYFDSDPRKLTYLKDTEGRLHGILSRRFDGALPGTVNPAAIWEIKEYYYTTTFGSRIADGVYETQLDGYEIRDLSQIAKRDIRHIYFLDDYNTWWNMGKSYLCRIIDMLHMGLVDEVIFGREAIHRWPLLLQELISIVEAEFVKDEIEVSVPLDATEESSVISHEEQLIPKNET